MAGSTDINDPDKFVLYRYHPSLTAAALFAALFFLTTFLHIYQAVRKRAWFLTPFIIGGLFESVGYIGRILSSHDQFNLNPYIMQSLLLLVAPALYAASIYMILGRIVVLTDGQQYSVIRPTWLTKIFVAGDVLSFAAQGGGGGLLAGQNKFGEKLIVIGLFVQITFFGLFLICALVFQRRGKAHLKAIAGEVPWKKHLVALYATSGLILVRSVFRVIEYLQGNAGYLLRREVFLYVFDAVLMFAVMVIMNVVHPGDIAPLLKKKETGKRSEELQLRGSSREQMV